MSVRRVLGPRVTSDRWWLPLNSGSQTWGHYPFRFENMLVHLPSFKTSFLAWCNVDVRYHFIAKFRALKRGLKSWN